MRGLCGAQKASCFCLNCYAGACPATLTDRQMAGPPPLHGRGGGGACVEREILPVFRLQRIPKTRFPECSRTAPALRRPSMGGEGACLMRKIPPAFCLSRYAGACPATLTDRQIAGPPPVHGRRGSFDLNAGNFCGDPSTHGWVASASHCKPRLRWRQRMRGLVWSAKYFLYFACNAFRKRGFRKAHAALSALRRPSMGGAEASSHVREFCDG
jgi:hypothetical protein